MKGIAASPLKWIGIAVMVVITFVIYLAFLFIAHRGNPDFLSIDSCLDAGGQWNYETRACER